MGPGGRAFCLARELTVPTLSFHSLELLIIAHVSRNRAREDAQRPNALTLDAIVAVVMAAAAAEAFINELADHIRAWRDATSDWAPDTVTPAMSACADVIEELEDSQSPVTTKYLLASLALCGKSFPKDRAPFQAFAELMRLRNEIMHAKVAREDQGGHQGKRIADTLGQRGIAISSEPGVHFSWFNRIETPSVASWACDAARSIILATLDLIPDNSPPSYPGAVDSLKKSFREHAALS